MKRYLPPAVKLSFNLNLRDCCATGYWFCPACQRITEPKDREGIGQPGCAHCGYLRIKWNPPIDGFLISPIGERIPHPLGQQTRDTERVATVAPVVNSNGQQTKEN